MGARMLRVLSVVPVMRAVVRERRQPRRVWVWTQGMTPAAKPGFLRR